MYRLRDLGSTNGTYVNGRRIDGPVEVGKRDTITLGRSQALPWPEESGASGAEATGERPASERTTAARIITIGRRSANDVVLSQPNVSSIHARLVVTESEMVIEDLGSTNGTAVDRVTNKVTRAVVTPESVVFFGSTSYRVADLLEKAATRANGEPVPRRTVAPGEDSREPASHQAPEMSAVRLIYVLLGAAGLLVLLVVAIVAIRSVRPDSASPAGDSAVMASRDEAALEGNRPSDATQVNPLSQDPPVAATREERPDSEPPAAASSPEDRLSQALFVIACAKVDSSEAFRLGTAFAVDARHLVTAASVVQLLQRLQQDEYPRAVVYHPPQRKSYTIDKLHVHPKFLKADAEATSAREEHDSIQARFEDAPDPSQAESIKKQLLELRARALEALARRTSYDVAVIELSEAVPGHLTVSRSPGKLRPRQKLQVAAYAIDRADLFFDPELPIELHVMAARTDRLARVGPNTVPWLVATCSQHQLAYNYLGGPVLDGRNEVVAIYVRPSPPVGGDQASDLPTTCDACLVDRVREIPGVAFDEH